MKKHILEIIHYIIFIIVILAWLLSDKFDTKPLYFIAIGGISCLILFTLYHKTLRIDWFKNGTSKFWFFGGAFLIFSFCLDPNYLYRLTFGLFFIYQSFYPYNRQTEKFASLFHPKNKSLDDVLDTEEYRTKP